MKLWALIEKPDSCREAKVVKFFRCKPASNLNLVFTTRITASSGLTKNSSLANNFKTDLNNINKNYYRITPFLKTSENVEFTSLRSVDSSSIPLIKKILGITKIFTLKQIHSNLVFYLNWNNANESALGRLAGDGIFTDEKGLAIGVKVADCLPIYIFDKKYGIIAIAHAGWRGTLAQIGKNLVNAIRQKFGSSPTDLNFVLGPCIEQSCYEVGFEILSQFFNNIPGSERFFVQFNRKMYFDLKGLNRFLLNELGLTEIGSLDYCTKCHPDLFYSMRRDGTTGRNLALIYLSQEK